jgi:hypothetical protein
VPYPGSVDALTLTVSPFDGTTGATVTVTPPAGSPLTPTATSSNGGATWTANPIYPVAGKWVARWTITGTGAGIVEQEVWVSAPASPAAAVTWRPERWRVAAYIPGRTLVGAVDGYGNAVYTFDDTTHPRGAAVDLLITDACAWVIVKTGPVDATLVDSAAACAAKWTAAQIQQAYPDNTADATIAALLYQQAVAMRDELQLANEAKTGQDPEDPAAHLMPVYSFPAPVPWGDLIL